MIGGICEDVEGEGEGVEGEDVGSEGCDICEDADGEGVEGEDGEGVEGEGVEGEDGEGVEGEDGEGVEGEDSDGVGAEGCGICVDEIKDDWQPTRYLHVYTYIVIVHTPSAYIVHVYTQEQVSVNKGTWLIDHTSKQLGMKPSLRGRPPSYTIYEEP